MDCWEVSLGVVEITQMGWSPKASHRGPALQDVNRCYLKEGFHRPKNWKMFRLEMSFCRSPQRHSFGSMHYVSLKTGNDMEDLPNLFDHRTLLGTHRTYAQEKTETLWTILAGIGNGKDQVFIVQSLLTSRFCRLETMTWIYPDLFVLKEPVPPWTTFPYPAVWAWGHHPPQCTRGSSVGPLIVREQ